MTELQSIIYVLTSEFVLVERAESRWMDDDESVTTVHHTLYGNSVENDEQIFHFPKQTTFDARFIRIRSAPLKPTNGRRKTAEMASEKQT